MVNEILEIRREIDNLDAVLIETISKRMDLVLKIADLKMKNGQQVVDLDRKRELFEKVRKLGQKYSLDIDFIDHLYRLIHDYSVEKQSKAV